MKLSREHPIRLLAQTAIRVRNAFSNTRRVRKWRRKGLQCPENTFIYKDCTMGNPWNIVIGSNCCISDCELYALDRITIGNRTIIGKGVYLCTGSHDIDSPDFRLKTSPITIGSHVWIGTRATVLPGVTIGDGAVIGAMAVVAKDVPAGAVAVGNPARVVRTGRVCPVDFDPLYLATVDWRKPLSKLKDVLRRKRGYANR